MQKIQTFCVHSSVMMVRNISAQSIRIRFHSDSGKKLFDKILIANRGEIACRIIKTARQLGIKTVAVYSMADMHAKHVRYADEALFIGPSASIHSYLNMDQIMAAIRTSKADAVHPGYGFLSENPNFVKLLEAEGIAFIGPPAEAIARMGDKLESKRLAMAAAVNTIPGFDGIITDAEHCVSIAQQIGYPVMIKASAGGGGKGMRIADNDTAARNAFKLATDEAMSSFGDGRLLMEKFIQTPRHIEIQVLADKYGNTIHLNERECSIQRRNQKVLEEAPSPFITSETRMAMGTQAVNLCKRLAYCSAGTVEFLVDSKRNFYFLEMNTRLQVEHPVTEAITGYDLVEQMIRIAAGERLKIQQEDVKIDGWAIESRIYAEDPYKNFGTPSIGRLHKYIEPENARCDSGVEEGSEISLYYDPMISKMVCHGSTRTEAIQSSIKALDHYVCRGVSHNIPLLRSILCESTFRAGNLSTNYLSQVFGESFTGHRLTAQERRHVCVMAVVLYAAYEMQKGAFQNHHHHQPGGILNSKMAPVRCWDVVVQLENDDIPPVTGEGGDGGRGGVMLQVRHENGQFAVLQVQQQQDEGQFRPPPIVYIDEKQIRLGRQKGLFNVQMDNDGQWILMQLVSRSSVGDYHITYQGTTYKVNVMPKQAFQLLHLMPSKPKMDVSKLIKAPMPGVVKGIACHVGDDIVEGQELCIIEAMKMQNAMVAHSPGTIKYINVEMGQTVGEEDVLIEIA